MPHTPLIRSLTATVLAGALALGASPAMAQAPSVEVPGVGRSPACSTWSTCPAWS